MSTATYSTEPARADLSTGRASCVNRHTLKRERIGFGPDASTRPYCTCGWHGVFIYETDGAMSSRLQAQEREHLNGGVL